MRVKKIKQLKLPKFYNFIIVIGMLNCKLNSETNIQIKIQYYRPSIYNPICIDISESLILCNPYFAEQSSSIVRFNKHIYEVLYHIAKKTKILYTNIKLEVLKV